MGIATVIAHPNIALVKYWGKRHIPLNLPAVPSVSMTLSKYETKTTVVWGADQDEVWVGESPAPAAFAARALEFLTRIDANRPPCQIRTFNNFPTAAGLASSSSGFAALALAGLEASGNHPTPAQASVLARKGSGSACRSLWGGFVAWEMGSREDGEDCHGVPIADANHWDVAMVVGVVSDKKKSIGSTEAMKITAATSALYPTFIKEAEADVRIAKAAILSRDLHKLGEVMESSTFKMHATMHSSSPPIVYWQPETVACIQAVFGLRQQGIGAWLTMDAGPNIKVLCKASDASIVQQALLKHVDVSHILRPGPPPSVIAHD